MTATVPVRSVLHPDISVKRRWRVGLLIMAAGVACILFPAESVARKIHTHKCSVEEVRRIDPGKEAQCMLNGGAPRCEAGGWRCCYQRSDGGTSCGGLRSYTSFDPGRPDRPPRAGQPDLPPDRIDPPRRPPRADPGPNRVSDPRGPVRPPRADPGPSRVGPTSSPPRGTPILRSSGGKR